MISKFRKKPVIIEALQYVWNNRDQVLEFINGNNDTFDNAWIQEDKVAIKTLEGTITASIDDYIIKGVNGEFYPCKPDIFEKTYEKVD